MTLNLFVFRILCEICFLRLTFSLEEQQEISLSERWTNKQRESERGCEKGRIGGTFEGMEIIKAGWSTTEDWKKFMV